MLVGTIGLAEFARQIGADGSAFICGWTPENLTVDDVRVHVVAEKRVTGDDWANSRRVAGDWNVIETLKGEVLEVFRAEHEPAAAAREVFIAMTIERGAQSTHRIVGVFDAEDEARTAAVAAADWTTEEWEVLDRSVGVADE